MPKSAYPKAYKLGKDNQGFLMGLKNKIQVWFTGGPRVPSGFWKWREYPKVVFVIKGSGKFRFETTDGSFSMACSEICNWARVSPLERVYLSRINPWTRYHFVLMWPLAIHWSFIYRSKDVVRYPKYKSKFGIKKMFAGYLGWVRDSDKIYKPKVYAGGNF